MQQKDKNATTTVCRIRLPYLLSQLTAAVVLAIIVIYYSIRWTAENIPNTYSENIPNTYNYTDLPNITCEACKPIYHPSYPGATSSVEYGGIPSCVLKPYTTYYEQLQLAMENSKLRVPATQPVNEVPVFVTGNSANHYEESIGAVVSVQDCFPNANIIYYDLGLLKEQASRLRAVCSLEVRRFDSRDYPVNVGLLEEKRWKPHLVHQILIESPLVFWMDASVRFACDNQVRFNEFWRHSVEMSVESGAVMFSDTAVSNFQVIHPMMYSYITTEHGQMKRTRQYQSGAVLFWREHMGMMLRVMKWWVLCALQPTCLHPKPGMPDGDHDQYARWHDCNFSGGSGQYADCHRQDQAALNVLLLNLHQFDVTRFAHEPATYGRFVRIHRSEPGDWTRVKMCSTAAPDSH